MLSYGAWNIIGSGTGMANSAGTNILMNIFFGPALNAANAIAQQVNAAVSSFYGNFTTALSPQIVKTYAAKEMQTMKTLIFRGGKFSFFLVMIFLIPVFLETDILLKFWLKSVPDYAGVFTKLITIASLIGCFGSTISMAVQATGKIKYYQIAVGGTLLLAFPVTYILYALGFNPARAYAGIIVTSAAAVFARMVCLKKYLGIKYREYFKNVLLLSAVVFVFSLPAPYFAKKIMNESLIRLVFVSGVSLASSLFFIYLLGLTKNEREFVNKFIKTRIFNKRQDSF
jgi:O-antigen/teichoic acid export membrane protein